MKRTAWILAVAVCLTACGGAPTTAEQLVEEPDAAAAPDALVTPDSGGYQRDGGAAEGQAPTPDAAPDAVVLRPDSAPPSSGPDAATEAAPDAAPAPPGKDAAPPVSDAAGGNVDGGAVCSSTAPACVWANMADAAIRAQFPPTRQSCTEGARKCGEVDESGTPVTEAMVCRGAQWRLAGSFSNGTWFPLYECSKGCGGVGKICDP